MLINKLKNNKTILKNTGYLSIIEIIRLIMPFIALPYIIRTVGAGNYGTAVFAQTIISYFSIFINWGLDISAVKDVSVHRNEPNELNRIVSAVLSIKSLLLLCSFVVLLVGLWSIPYMAGHKTLFLFAFITCFSEILFPVWFYQGIEKMKYLTLVRTSSIIFYTIAVFCFIHAPEDYERIVLLQSLGNLLAGAISLYLLFVVNKVRLVRVGLDRLRSTFTDSFPFFMSRLSVILNNTMAKTMSGIFFSMEAVAAFDLAQKIAHVSLIPMQMLNQAVYPHIAKTLSKSFVRKFLYVNISLSTVVATALFILAPFGIHFFAAEQLDESVSILRILTLWVLFGGMTTYIGSPVLVSFGYPKPFNISVILSTVTLGVLYLIFYLSGVFTIYHFAWALVISEFVILLYRGYYCFYYRIISFKRS